MRSWNWTCLAVLLAALAPAIPGKRVEGAVALKPGQATIVTKFCFDFNAACVPPHCPKEDDYPGVMNFQIFGARRSDGVPVVLPPSGQTMVDGQRPFNQAKKKPENEGPELWIALLDDEYFSFPEVSQVWGEANCSDILHAGKKNFRLHWDQISQEPGPHQGQHIKTPLVEHLRPRWWYIALVSCAPYGIELSYKMHLTNDRVGWEREFSMDTVGTLELALFFCVALGGILAIQVGSMMEWKERNRSLRWGHLHPALILVTVSIALAMIGQTFWFFFYWHYQSSGQSTFFYDVLARGCITAAKTLMQVLFMLFAQGQCVATPDISFHAQQELLLGQALFGACSFLLECWGDNEFSTTSTEYIYDTRPGMLVVAFDCFWLWLYASRSHQTFQKQIKRKPREFYQSYAVVFGLWFASLPVVAILARALASHVRYRITFAVNGFVHIAILSLVIHTFRPSVASNVYDLRLSEYDPVADDQELASMIGQSSRHWDDDML